MSNLSNILFLDIETVPLAENFEQLPETLQQLWLKKFEQINKKGSAEGSTDAENYFGYSSVYAEFAKVVCISIGMFHRGKMVIKSIAGDSEREILVEFIKTVEKLSVSRPLQFCGHNIKEFDIPFICRRILVNKLRLPSAINVSGKKPWEVPFIDTLELWRFGDYKGYTSLKLLVEILDIPTPKDDIDGSQVAEVYYKQGDLRRICIYCQKDVLATVRLYQRLTGMELIIDDDVRFIE